MSDGPVRGPGMDGPGDRPGAQTPAALALEALGRLPSLFRSALPGRAVGGGPVRYLHVGKAAGTAVRSIADRVNASAGSEVIRRERHRVTLHDIPDDARYFFSIRDPVDRFVSGFHSRKRKGQPRTYSEWSAAETWAFAAFESAADLADALFAPGEDGRRALAAIKSIQHTYRGQIDWLDQHGDALFTRPPVWIVRQAHFVDDMTGLLTRLGYSRICTPDLLGKRRHVGNYRDVQPLSAAGRANLERWYAQDVAFYAACEDWIEQATIADRSLA